MNIIKHVKLLQTWRNSAQGTIGFVPTMGALHRGHLSLVKQSKIICDITLVSIFINPLQFAPNEDLTSYPRTLNKDLQCLKELDVDIVFIPSNEEMEKVTCVKYLDQHNIFEILEGKSRPHFFYGVTTVVTKLFNITNPTYVFFGEKDAQQLLIIKNMICDMNYNIILIPCPTIRNKNGLALSSRNEYLSSSEKKEAALLYASLLKIRNAIVEGETCSIKLKKIFEITLSQSPKFAIDYISIAEFNTLNEIEKINAGKLLISAAVFFNKIRLIDNLLYQSST